MYDCVIDENNATGDQDNDMDSQLLSTCALPVLAGTPYKHVDRTHGPTAVMGRGGHGKADIMGEDSFGMVDTSACFFQQNPCC